MEIRIGFMHTTPATVKMANYFTAKCLPGARAVNVQDDVLKINNYSSDPGVTPRENLLKFAGYAKMLQDAGCRVIVSCCSLMPDASRYAAQTVSVPVIQMDGYVMDHAVSKYNNIAVYCNAERTLPFAKKEMEARIAAAGRNVKFEIVHGKDSFQYFNDTQMDLHDRKVLDDLLSLDEKGYDCIMMGQIPMGLLEERIRELKLKTPCFCAGSMSFEYIKSLL